MNDEYSNFAGKYGYQKSVRFLKILIILMNEDEVRLVNKLPASPEALSQGMNKTPPEINTMLQNLYKKGVIFESSKGYRPARDVLQLHDSTGSDMRSDEVWGRKLLDAWWDFSENELFPQIAQWAQNFERPLSRIIPARAAVADNGKLLAIEDIDSILDKTTRFAVVKCPCRRMAQKCDRPLEVCLQLNKGADYAVKRGSGKELSREEAKSVIREAAESGLIHTVINVSDVSSVICNCCGDCCIFIYPYLKYGGLEKGIAKSRFEARVDIESCSGCQDCVERCQFNAIEMVKIPGQKKLKAKVDAAKCYGCGVCAVNCTTDSIKLYEARPAEHIPA